MERLLSAGEVADLLQVPKATLYAWRYKGVGPVGYRVGRHVRYDPADVKAWLDDNRSARGTGES